jgi:hypothetical protein
VKGREFSLAGHAAYAAYLKEHPDGVTSLKLTPQLGASILNYVNGKRSAATIRNYVAAETGQDLSLESVVKYLELMKTVRWLTLAEAVTPATK